MDCDKCCDIDHFRKLGQERIEFAMNCKSAEEWAKWPEPRGSFIFKRGDCWTFTAKYVVKDFAAECGFLIDALGLYVNAFGNDYAMFMSPDAGYYFSVVPESDTCKATDPASFELEFMLHDILGNCSELKKRGINFERAASAFAPGSPLYNASFRTPNGIRVVLWGIVEKRVETDDGCGCCVDC